MSQKWLNAGWWLCMAVLLFRAGYDLHDGNYYQSVWHVFMGVYIQGLLLVKRRFQ